MGVLPPNTPPSEPLAVTMGMSVSSWIPIAAFLIARSLPDLGRVSLLRVIILLAAVSTQPGEGIIAQGSDSSVDFGVGFYGDGRASTRNIGWTSCC